MVWTAVSALRSKVTTQEIREDETKFLLDYFSNKTKRKESLKTLMEVAPATAEKLHELAQALEKSQNYLQVSDCYQMEFWCGHVCLTDIWHFSVDYRSRSQRRRRRKDKVGPRRRDARI
jgi:hypothetical protein